MPDYESQYGEVEKIILSHSSRFDSSLFSKEELVILHYISDKFKDTTASDIAEISHKESAWQANIDGKKIIPFYYAFDLKTV